MFEAMGLHKKEGNSLVYVTLDGEIIKQFRKAWERNDNNGLTKIMEEIPIREQMSGNVTEEPDILIESEDLGE